MNRYILLSLLVLPTPLFAQPEQKAQPKPLAITNVTVIDTTGGPSVPDMTVVITGDRITTLGRTNEVALPDGAQAIDGTGKFLIPGLWDMHAHWYHKPSLTLFTANGVTGIRIMWGVPRHLEWRKELADGSLLGPRMILASKIVDGPKPLWDGSIAVKTPEDGRRAVQESKQAGYDFVKVYNTLPRDAYFAIADEAKKLGLPFAGHVPEHTVSVAEASDAGQRSMEHLYMITLGCSSQEAKLRAQLAELIGDGTLERDWALWRRILGQIMESYDETKAAALFARFKKNGTRQVPTLTMLRVGAYGGDPKFTSDPRLKYIHHSTKERWQKERDKPWATMPMKGFESFLKLVQAMHRAGVPILAGTDCINPYCFPGFSLHDELALFVEAGLSPLDALQTATLNPAKYLDRQQDLGTVEQGKLADLVLLDADPLKDIQNTKKIASVIVGGKLLIREELDKMLADVEAEAGKQ